MLKTMRNILALALLLGVVAFCTRALAQGCDNKCRMGKTFMVAKVGTTYCVTYKFSDCGYCYHTDGRCPTSFTEYEKTGCWPLSQRQESKRLDSTTCSILCSLTKGPPDNYTGASTTTTLPLEKYDKMDYPVYQCASPERPPNTGAYSDKAAEGAEEGTHGAG